MTRIHIALAVGDVERSIEDYSLRLGRRPTVVVPGEYALWRTDAINLSIKRSAEPPGTLRHLGWEDSTAPAFARDKDVNGIVWERFAAQHQDEEIKATWPSAELGQAPRG